MSTEASTFIGRRIGNWKLLRLLGEGAFGAVYEAESTTIAGRHAAVKVLHAHMATQVTIKQRCLNEASAASRAEHENIIQIFDGGITDDETCYCVMELLHGTTLTQLMQHGKIDLGRTINIGSQVAGALQAAHELSIVHRDLKPDNIFVIARPTNPEFVKVLDFGVAKLRDQAAGPSLTQSGMMIGTPGYMSPEQWMSLPDVDGRADVYALGMILYQCLTGKLPFTGNTPYQWLKAHLEQPVPDLTGMIDMTPEMASLIGRMLAKDRKERPRSMVEVLAELEQARVAAGAPATPQLIGLKKRKSSIEVTLDATGPTMAVAAVAGPVAEPALASQVRDEAALSATSVEALPPRVATSTAGAARIGFATEGIAAATPQAGLRGLRPPAGTGMTTLSAGAGQLGRPAATRRSQALPMVGGLAVLGLLGAISFGVLRYQAKPIPAGRVAPAVQRSAPPDLGAPPVRRVEAAPAAAVAPPPPLAPAPPLAKAPSSSEIDRLLRAASHAYDHHDYEAASAAAHRANEGSGGLAKAWKIIAASACFQKNPLEAIEAWAHVAPADRGSVKRACDRNHIRLVETAPGGPRRLPRVGVDDSFDASAPGEAGLPAQLEHRDIVAGMSSVDGAVGECFDRFKVEGSVMVTISIAPSGKVKSASIRGALVGSAAGDCVVGAVEGAAFKRFGGQPMSIVFSFPQK
ncbi:MAG: serine/threonine protein kinase [Myxococcales bacterium]|nr:serine/threonine protein kinase [Myxococcales bacterium]